MSLESAKVNFNIFLFVATEARNLSDIFVESFRLHMLSRFLFIYQLNDCKQINSYHIFSEKLKSYKAVYKYAKKKPKPCLELLCCRGKEQLKMRNKTRLSLCQKPVLEDGWCWGRMKERLHPDRENLSLLWSGRMILIFHYCNSRVIPVKRIGKKTENLRLYRPNYICSVPVVC